MLSQPASPLDWPDLDNLDDPAVLRARVDRVPQWFHRLDLPGNVQTQGIYSPADKLHRVGLPERLDGQSVLDIGPWDGFYSFECERRGASHVTCTDTWDPAHFVTSEGFAVAHRALKSRVVPLRVSLYDLDPGVHGIFDLVLFLGVLYHLTNPFEALQRLRPLTRKTLIIETASDMLFTSSPALRFYPNTELGQDGTNWFAPNAAALVGMCKAAGYREASVYWRMSAPMSAARAAYRFFKFRENPVRGLQRGRIVVHAQV